MTVRLRTKVHTCSQTIFVHDVIHRITATSYDKSNSISLIPGIARRQNVISGRWEVEYEKLCAKNVFPVHNCHENFFL